MVFFSARAAAKFDARTAVAATFLRVTALACAFVTLVLAAMILSWQEAAWILRGKWNSFPISRALALAGLDEPPADPAAAGVQLMLNWGRDLPASGLLLGAAAILMGFAVFAASIEEQFGKK